ncbi:SRPBCC family protein [Gallaecimonas sp. GXIMD4217]|uniref:SRPBCC family protein n=1 Tax=Gallaecimonas sp. GXIMD4217 TaxID=3131927 RepID=UPI00311B1A19
MKITIETLINADLASTWDAWNNPDDIVRWNAASDDWHTTSSRVDLRVGGSFSSRMEAKDGSMGFDFEGTYTEVEPQARLQYRMADGREVLVTFEAVDGGVRVLETFDADQQHDPDFQRQGWQSILDSFARHVEAKG